VNTDDLIESLASDLRRVPAGQAGRRLACFAGLGLVATTLVVWLTLGLREDLGAVLSEPVFLVRQVYTLGIAGFGALLLLRLGQPGAPLRLPLLGLAATLVMVLVAVVMEQASLSGAAHVEAWLGESWRSCMLRIGVISLAAGPFIFLAARRLAPGRPTLAGFAAGLVAGALAATGYGLYCVEDTASFTASWYTLGILAAGAVGAAGGRYLLRW